MKSQFRFSSPMRYPGGKGRLANFVGALLEKNNLCDGDYAEPYAGGAGIAIKLLEWEYVRRVHINDIDNGIFAFWHAVMNETDALCRRIREVRLNMQVWKRQKEIQLLGDSADRFDLAFSTFYLNRTNRSGIIAGGVVGGKRQRGKWSMDARFNRRELCERIRRFAAFRDRVLLYNWDALDFLTTMASSLPERSLTYCDPPYLVKGRLKLYTNYYQSDDHRTFARAMQSYPHPWLLTYDYAPEIVSLYRGYARIRYDLNYSAADRYRGREVMFFSPLLSLPSVANPAYHRAAGSV